MKSSVYWLTRMAAAAQQEATCLSDTNAEVGKQGTSEDGLLQHMDEQEH